MKNAERGRLPSHKIFVPKDQGRWIEVGAMWPNQPGKGFSIVLQALPTGTRLTALPIKDNRRNTD